MCERARDLVTAIVCALALAAPAAAQDAAAHIARLQARADSLEAARDAAEARLLALRPRERASAPLDLDTQRVGPVSIISESGEAEYARETTTRALAELGDVPTLASTALDSTYFVFVLDRGADVFDALDAGHRLVRIGLSSWLPRSSHAHIVATAVSAALASALPVDLRAWSGTAGIPVTRDALYREAYRSLLLSPSPAARACRDGIIARCADALSLTDPGASWERWYDEAALVEWALAQEERPGARACDSGRTLEACRAVIERGSGPPPPLRVVARTSLLALVLEEGGSEAWDRLAADSAGPIADRLAHAAGTDVDGLLESWRARVLAAGPAHSAGLGGSWVVTLVWVALLAAVASRSTRWRLG